MIAAIRDSGIAADVLALSNVTGAGLDELRRRLVPGRTCCLLGSSGVGKTTIINRLLGRDAFAAKAVSATGEGIHTTSRRQLVVLDRGALLIDTPGMRELGILASGDAVEDGFSDLHGLAAACRYADCTHGDEPGCSVREALERGALSGDRYRSYLKLRKESAYHEASYAERRRKDKAFGKFVKQAKARQKH
jgi:ribosome biogenesis GTPase